MNTSSNRNRALDLAKGIGMLFVMCYHLVYRTRDGMIDKAICGAIWLYLPLFFAIAGYTYRPGRRTLWQNICHRFKTLLLPSIISCCVLLFFGGLYFKATDFFGDRAWLRDAVHTFLRPELGKYVIDDNGGVLFHNISPVWFVWTLWWATLLFYFVADFSLKSGGRFIVSTVLLMALGTAFYTLLPPTPWSISLAPVYAAMMLLGAYAAKAKLFTKRKLNPILSLVAAAAGLAVQAIMFKHFGTDQIYAGQLGTTGVWDPILCYVQMAVGGLGIMLLCSLLSGIRLLSPVNWIGRNSLVFLLMHCIFGAVAANLLNAPIKTGGQWYLSPLSKTVAKKSILGMLISAACCALVAVAVKFAVPKISAMLQKEDE